MKSNTDLSSEKRFVFPVQIIFVVSPFLVGVYHEWISCIISIALLIYLFNCRRVSGKLAVLRSPVMAACTAVVIFFAISPLWAVDKGMAVFGFVKFLPLPLFCTALAQIDPKSRRKALDTVPICGAVMTVLSFSLSFVPVLQNYLLVSGRLAGFFQYPNTFAVYLLVGLIITVLGSRPLKYQLSVSAVLIFGLIASGSRTTFILLAVSVAGYAVFSKNRRLKLSLLSLFIAAAAISALYAFLSGNLDTAGRFLTSSLTSSTFIGRLLYYKDAIPVILKHPLGLGYMGYYYSQGSFQSGVYYVLNVHNEFLQILLDIGWAPFAICVWAAVTSFKKQGILSKAVIGLTLAHCLLDFDMQFIAMDFLLILAAGLDDTSAVELKRRPHQLFAGMIMCGVCLYFGTASCGYYFKNYAVAEIYPAYTRAYIDSITETADLSEQEKLANKILKLNRSVSVAYSVKARAAFSQGDISQMIDNKKRAILLSKYSMEEYVDYADMLKIAIELYERSGDQASASQCRDRLKEIPLMLQKVKEETSALAWMIDDKPELEWYEE